MRYNYLKSAKLLNRYPAPRCVSLTPKQFKESDKHNRYLAQVFPNELNIIISENLMGSLVTYNCSRLYLRFSTYTLFLETE